MSYIQSFLELPFVFDIKKLEKDLALVNEDNWVKHPNTNAYDGIWEVTSLTSTNGDIKNIIALENQEYKDTPLMNKTKYIKEILKNFSTKIEAIRFMKLGANSIIKEHCDKGSCFEEGYARLHIPIISNENIEFILSGKSYKMDLGKCYYIDANNPHSVVNRGDSDRVHLLIDCHVNDWMKDIFLKGGFKEPVYKYGSKFITDENVDEIIKSFKAMGTDTALKIADELKNKKLSTNNENLQNSFFEIKHKNLSFINELQEDKEFLLSLYTSVRQEELLQVNMTNQQKEIFLASQFELRQKDYKSRFNDALFLIITKQNQNIGRIIIEEKKEYLHLVDIAFINEFRNQGFGTKLLKELILKAKCKKKIFKLSVSCNNSKAIKLYKSLGLEIVKKQNNYYEMQTSLKEVCHK